MPPHPNNSFVVVGGGFYGCCLALYLRSLSERVILLESGPDLMLRASRVNQARVHTGFHYPRSPLTAVKSLRLHRRFAEDFPDAVVGNFRMLYAIARRGSRITATRFHRMFSGLRAPMREASPAQRSLFEPRAVEAVFDCYEAAFDHSIIREQLKSRLIEAGVDVRLNADVVGIHDCGEKVVCNTADGHETESDFVFNVTYAQLNGLLRTAGLKLAALKYELAEIALVKPPDELDGFGVTVMDGPFFSCMPFPSDGLFSLSHVRYTPHFSWTDDGSNRSPYDILRHTPFESRFRYMIGDAKRFLPLCSKLEWQGSHTDVKTVLLRNERDDGRPILFHRAPGNSRIISILGGKLDNIYDLFAVLRTAEPSWNAASTRFLFPSQRPS
jgi:glycine/D-amino acid oxidase-like deaminating enzyme